MAYLREATCTSAGSRLGVWFRKLNKAVFAAVLAGVLATAGAVVALAEGGGGTGGGGGGETAYGSINWSWLWDDDYYRAVKQKNPIQGWGSSSVSYFYNKIVNEMDGLPIDGTANGYGAYVSAANDALDRAHARGVSRAMQSGMTRAEAEAAIKTRVIGVGWTWQAHPEYNQAWGIYYVIDNGEHGSGPRGSWGIYDDTKLKPASSSGNNSLRNGADGDGWDKVYPGTNMSRREWVLWRANEDVGHHMGHVFTVVATSNFEFEDSGYIKLEKGTEDSPAWVLDNSMYSLAGAEYGVYKSVADARNNVSAEATLVTGATGATDVVELDEGTYYLRETKFAKGHYLDGEIHGPYEVKTSHTKDKPLTVSLTDVAAYEHSTVSVFKSSPLNPDTGLPGAVYAVRYYDELVDNVSALANKSAKRTWYIETGEDGVAYLDSAHLASGGTWQSDALWMSGSDVVLPLGTVSVVEVQPPEGYSLDNGKPNADGTLNEPDVFLRQLTLPSNIVYNAANVKNYPTSTRIAPAYYVANTDIYGNPTPSNMVGAVNTATIVQSVNTPQRGDLELEKVDGDIWLFVNDEGDWTYAGADWPWDENSQGDGVMHGAVFDIYNETGGVVESPLGEEIENGALVCSIVTRPDGMACTKYEDVNGWATLGRLKVQGGALQVGTYRVVERIPPVGYKPNESWLGWAAVEYNVVVRVVSQ